MCILIEKESGVNKSLVFTPQQQHIPHWNRYVPQSNESMASAAEETLHQEGLRRLCFACGKIFKAKERRHEVEQYLEMISKAMDCPAGIFTMEGVTPSHFCHGCKLNLLKLSSGETITTKRRLINWEECHEGCSTCGYMTKRKRGGVAKKVSEMYYFL